LTQARVMSRTAVSLKVPWIVTPALTLASPAERAEIFAIPAPAENHSPPEIEDIVERMVRSAESSASPQAAGGAANPAASTATKRTAAGIPAARGKAGRAVGEAVRVWPSHFTTTTPPRRTGVGNGNPDLDLRNDELCGGVFS
jgi:hypothetical protein